MHVVLPQRKKQSRKKKEREKEKERGVGGGEREGERERQAGRCIRTTHAAGLSLLVGKLMMIILHLLHHTFYAVL